MLQKLGTDAGQTAATLLEAADKHLDKAFRHMPEHAVIQHEPHIQDGVRCLTEYEPRAERTDDLVSRVVGGMAEGKWKRDLYEYTTGPDGLNQVRIIKEKVDYYSLL